MKGRPNIVVPTIRSPEFFNGFLNNWKEEFSGCHLIVIEDREKKLMSKLLEQHSKDNNYTYELYDWRDIDKDLKDDAWIISRQTDCVRNYGYLKAYKNQALFIVTLDDDLKPATGHIMRFYNNLFNDIEVDGKYFSTISGDVPRGVMTKYPQEVVVSHGYWHTVPDFSAKQQISKLGKFDIPSFYNGHVPIGAYYSMCGMNLAWKTDFTKYMYFPLMGAKGGYPIDRCGDIWAGYYSKHKADEREVLHVTGKPYAIHERASNVWTNLIKEKDEDVMGVEFINSIIKGNKPYIEKEYFKKLKQAYKIWGRLIDEATK